MSSLFTFGATAPLDAAAASSTVALSTNAGLLASAGAMAGTPASFGIVAAAAPVSAASSNALLWGSLAAAGLGTGVSALGMMQAGQAQAQAAKGQQAVANYNARVQEQEARSIEQATRYRQLRHAESANRYGSSLLANMGASGVSLSEGSPLLIAASQAAQSEMDNLMIGYEGQVAESRSRNQAHLDTLQGQIYGQQARSATAAGYVGAGSSLLTGFGTMGMFLADRQPSKRRIS